MRQQKSFKSRKTKTKPNQAAVFYFLDNQNYKLTTKGGYGVLGAFSCLPFFI